MRAVGRWLLVALVVNVAVILYGTLGPVPDDELSVVREVVGDATEVLEPGSPEGEEPSGRPQTAPAPDRPWPFGLTSEDVGNVAMFVPLPVLVALRWPRWWWAGVPLGVAFSGAIELTQLYVLDHRSPQWSDLAFNSTGAVLGLLLWAVGTLGPPSSSRACTTDQAIERERR